MNFLAEPNLKLYEPAMTPEVWHPAQLPQQEKPCQGERRLLIAILADGIRLALTAMPRAVRGTVYGRELREARAWVADETERPMGFRWTCDLLGLDAGWVRKNLPLALLTLKGRRW